MKKNSNGYAIRAEGESLLNTPGGKNGKPGKGMSKKRVNKMLNSAIDGLLTDQLPKTLKDTLGPLLAEYGKTTPKEPAAPSIEGVPAEVSAQLHTLKQQNEELSKAMRAITQGKQESDQKVEKSERENAIRDAMGKFQFASDSAREAAFKLIALEVKRNDKGEIVAGDNLPVTEFVKEALTKKHDYFLAPVDVSGANATRGITRGQATVGMETIKKGMSAEERAAVAQEIGRAVQASQVL